MATQCQYAGRDSHYPGLLFEMRVWTGSRCIRNAKPLGVPHNDPVTHGQEAFETTRSIQSGESGINKAEFSVSDCEHRNIRYTTFVQVTELRAFYRASWVQRDPLDDLILAHSQVQEYGHGRGHSGSRQENAFPVRSEERRVGK